MSTPLLNADCFLYKDPIPSFVLEVRYFLLLLRFRFVPKSRAFPKSYTAEHYDQATKERVGKKSLWGVVVWVA